MNIDVNVVDPSDDNNDNEMAVLHEAAKIIEGAQDDVNLEGIFTIANKVGAYLLVWRKMMVNGIGDNPEGFDPQWVEEAAMNLFHKFFHPYEPQEPQNVTYEFNGTDDDD